MKLYVFHKQNLVGTLRRSAEDTLHFQYAQEWLSSQGHGAFSLTPALPMTEDEFNHRQTKAYFDNLLPEGDSLKTLQTIYKKSLTDSFQFLQHFGLDSAGALTISVHPEAQTAPSAELLTELPLQDIYKLIKQKKSIFVYSLKEKKARFSLAGAQDKIPVIYRDQKVYIPQDGTPTTHILKPPSLITEAYESVYNEHICLQMAKKIGFEVPDNQVIGGEKPLFLIERYDRKQNNNAIERLHQFDLCQGMGFPQGEKYEEEGGPGIAQSYQFIGDHSDRKIQDLQTYIDWVVFNLLIGNNDCHAKNLSFLYNDQECHLAPIYDVLSIGLYGDDFDPSFAYEIGGVLLWNEVWAPQLSQLAFSMDFKREDHLIKKTIVDLCERVPEALTKTITEVEEKFGPLQICRALQEDVDRRIKHFSKIFDRN